MSYYTRRTNGRYPTNKLSVRSTLIYLRRRRGNIATLSRTTSFDFVNTSGAARSDKTECPAFFTAGICASVSTIRGGRDCPFRGAPLTRRVEEHEEEEDDPRLLASSRVQPQVQLHKAIRARAEISVRSRFLANGKIIARKLTGEEYAVQFNS